MPQPTINHSVANLPWESGMRADNALEALLMALVGGRTVRLVTPGASQLTYNGNKAIARALYVYGGTTMTVVLADDDSTVGGDGVGGPTAWPYGTTTGFLFPFHVSHVISSDATKILAIFG